MRYRTFWVLALFALPACTSLQTVNKLQTQNLQRVCIVEHKAVRPEVLEAIEDVFQTRGIKTQVVRGDYRLSNNQWRPTYQVKDVTGCDAVLFYVANWHWDLATYMNFCNIWVTSAGPNPTRLGNATYDARASLNKYINADQKIRELARGLLGE